MSVVDAVEAALEAIEAGQPRLNAFTTVFADEARMRAKELDAAGPSGPLHGVPVAVKDLFDVTGARTTGSCAALFVAPPASQTSYRLRRLRVSWRSTKNRTASTANITRTYTVSRGALPPAPPPPPCANKTPVKS